MTETLPHWYSSDSTEMELFDEYQHGRVYMAFKHFSGFVSNREKVKK